MASFWSGVLGFRIDERDDGSAKLFPPTDAPGALIVWLQPSGQVKRDKNRHHLDLVASDGSAEEEVIRLLGLGARHADVGQTGTEGFTVLCDPEGNECLRLVGS